MYTPGVMYGITRRSDLCQRRVSSQLFCSVVVVCFGWYHIQLYAWPTEARHNANAHLRPTKTTNVDKKLLAQSEINKLTGAVSIVPAGKGCVNVKVSMT